MNKLTIKSVRFKESVLYILNNIKDFFILSIITVGSLIVSIIMTLFYCVELLFFPIIYLVGKYIVLSIKVKRHNKEVDDDTKGDS